MSTSGDGSFSEAQIQAFVHAHPECLPVSEIDPVFVSPVAVCRELNTLAGPIDNLLITPSGLPIIVECKLWRNPEGRREVVGQILDYAKELSRWSSSDLQREVAKRTDLPGNPLLKLLADAGHQVDEIQFNDALTSNLRRGRFLLLIVGDGIREGVEAIATYLQGHLGLHFSLGLVEMPIFSLPDGSHLVTPRVLARTTLITRSVIAVPDGHAIEEEGDAEVDPDRESLTTEQQKFWEEFLAGLSLDDPEQPVPTPAKLGYLFFMLPAPQGSCWINVWRDISRGRVGLTLSFTQGSVGEAAVNALMTDIEAVLEELGGDATISEIRGVEKIHEEKVAGDLRDPQIRAAAFEWLRGRLDSWVNVLRPRIRATVMDMD
ncbi:hypothetical protein [Altererythrobacter sp. BO-6]|uniref:hypothetical protein n=1 Tax=Altererythrobacter sp. BO-6 TaxID=2604537 RepID=UPI0019D0262F|nr:hypothetical protein [Altererythrobacter sp. BO-6]